MSESPEPAAKKRKVEIEKEAPTEDKTVDEGDFTEDLQPSSENFEVSNDKYQDFVKPEELERLREFKVLDEVKSNDEDSNDNESESSDDVPEEEIEKMLDEDLPEGFKGVPKPKEKAYITRQKTVLEEKGVNHFEVLPLDWMMVRHYSGMPIYMHRSTRVCTLSKPYCLGKGNTRRHDIPISAIPCLAYRKALEEEEKQLIIDKQIEEQIRTGSWQKNLDKNKSNSINKVANDKTDKDISSQNASGNKDTSKCPFSHISDKLEDNKEASSDIVVNENEILNKSNLAIENNLEAESVKNDTDDKIEEVTNIKDTKSPVTINDSNDLPNSTNDSQVTDKTEEQDVPKENEPQTEGDKEEIPLNRQPVVLPGGIVMPPPRVETVSTSWKTQHLSHETVNDYCKKLFKFKTVNIMHFKRWADRHKYTKARKTLQYPTMPEGTKLITIPAQVHENGGGKANKRDWVMNMNGRSYLSVFHEYVQQALQKQPVYEFKQLENASTPYQATVYIGGMQYGVGHGSSKRSAKSAAARASIHILIPDMRDDPAPQPMSNPDFSVSITRYTSSYIR